MQSLRSRPSSTTLNLPGYVCGGLFPVSLVTLPRRLQFVTAWAKKKTGTAASQWCASAASHPRGCTYAEHYASARQVPCEMPAHCHVSPGASTVDEERQQTRQVVMRSAGRVSMSSWPGLRPVARTAKQLRFTGHAAHGHAAHLHALVLHAKPSTPHHCGQGDVHLFILFYLYTRLPPV